MAATGLIRCKVKGEWAYKWGKNGKPYVFNVLNEESALVAKKRAEQWYKRQAKLEGME